MSATPKSSTHSAPCPGPGEIALPVALLLDLDGTLVHSLPEICMALNGGLADTGRPPANEADVRAWIGDGARRLCSRAIGTEDEAAPGVDEVHEGLRRHYFRDPGCLTVEYDGVSAMLTQLRDLGVRLGCVTNKPEDATGPLLARLGLASFFEVVVCPETVGLRKPDAAPMRHALAGLDAAPDDALHVGDGTADVLSARAAGVRVVAITGGYGAPEGLLAAEPDWQLARLTDLSAAFADRR